MVIVTGLNHYGTGIWKLFSILIGIIAGYGVWLCFGMVDFSAVSGASLFQLPRLLHFGTIFEPSACVAIGILFAINSIQAIGDFTAITTGGMDRMPTDEELNGGIVAYIFCNIISALFGGLPTAITLNLALPGRKRRLSAVRRFGNGFDGGSCQDQQLERLEMISVEGAASIGRESLEMV